MELEMIKEFTKYYRPYMKTLYAVILGSLLAAGLDLIFPMAVRYVLNIVLPEKGIDKLNSMSLTEKMLLRKNDVGQYKRLQRDK